MIITYLLCIFACTTFEVPHFDIRLSIIARLENILNYLDIYFYFSNSKHFCRGFCS